jgi:hypothetical protein
MKRDRILAIAREAAREYARELWRAQFVDMGYDDCETCRRARLREAWLEHDRTPKKDIRLELRP